MEMGVLCGMKLLHNGSWQKYFFLCCGCVMFFGSSKWVPRVGKCNSHEMLRQKCFHLFKSGPILENVEMTCKSTHGFFHQFFGKSFGVWISKNLLELKMIATVYYSIEYWLLLTYWCYTNSFMSKVIAFCCFHQFHEITWHGTQSSDNCANWESYC